MFWFPKEWIYLLTLNLSFLFFKNGLKEEELGPLPLLPARNGPCVQTRIRKGCLVDTGQKMFFQGNGNNKIRGIVVKIATESFQGNEPPLHENFQIICKCKFLPVVQLIQMLNLTHLASYACTGYDNSKVLWQVLCNFPLGWSKSYFWYWVLIMGDSTDKWLH